MKRTWMMVLLVTLLLSACAPVTAPTPAPSATPLSVAVLAPTSTATPTDTPTPLPTPTDTATPSPTPSPTPTATPTPIPTLPPEQIGGLSGVPDPRVTNPELFDLTRRDAPIPQFVNAMTNAGIEVLPDKVLNNLQFISKKADDTHLLDKDGKPFIVVAYSFDPNLNQTGETLEGPIPLFIATQNENGGWKWSNFDITLGFVLNNKETSVTAESGWGNSLLRAGVESGWQYFRQAWAVSNIGEETTYHPTDPNSLNFRGVQLASRFISLLSCKSKGPITNFLPGVGRAMSGAPGRSGCVPTNRGGG